MKTVKDMVKEEMNKQMVRTMRSGILTENVKNVYDATKLVRKFTKEETHKLPLAKTVLKLAEAKLNEFYEEEWEMEYGGDEFEGEIEGGEEMIEVDNSPLYDSLLCIMDCAKELYMNVDMDSEVDPMVVSRIQQAEAAMRTACEAYKLATQEMEDQENSELSDEYISQDDDDFDGDMDDCVDCEESDEFDDDEEEMY